MFGAAVASLVGAAAYGYSYNLSRFKFDAKLRQECQYHYQDMRIELWKLFREDVRDVFELTRANMDNYMVVGVLIIASVMNFMAVGYPTFPSEPPWLVVIWNNSVFSCVIFGMVGVWLAMHGSISATSASTKILTQAVRPPVASLVEVSEGMVSQEDYEAAGPRRYGQMPAFAEEPTLPDRDRVAADTPGVYRANSVPILSHDPRSPRGRSPAAASPRNRRTKAQDADGLKWLEETAHASHDIVEQLKTEDSGPGRSAALYSHFWMLRKVQRGYACFDAYARISLAVSAQQLLLVEAYYSLGHFMSKSDGWPSPVQNTEGAWLALLSGVYSCWILFRLDLYLKRKQRLLVQAGLWLAPVTAGVATQLFNIRTKHGEGGVRPCDQVVPVWLPWLVALLACLCHMLWILIIIFVSTPMLASAELPVAFRAAIYLDVFGWHSKYFKASLVHNAQGDITHWQAPEPMLQPRAAELEQDDQRRVFVTFKEGKRLLKSLTKLNRADTSKHFRDEDKRNARELQEILEELLKELECQLSVPWSRQTSDGWSRQSSPFGQQWLQSAADDGSGHLLPYWVDCANGFVIWSRPDGHILDLNRLHQSVEELQEKVMTTSEKTDPLVAAEALPFELMPVHPDTDESSSALPWKCLYRSCMAQIAIWIASLLVVLLDPVYYDTPIAPRELYDSHALTKMPAAWPNKRFRPSAIACAGDDIIYVGDQFAIYAADLYWKDEAMEPQTSDRHTRRARYRHVVHDRLTAAAGSTSILRLKNLTLHPAIPAVDIGSAWSSLGIIAQKGKLLLLDANGQQIIERSQYPWIPGQKIWRLGPTLPHKRVLAISVVEGRHAKICARPHSGFVNMGWAVIAATDSGQVVTLCPTQFDELHPIEMLLSLRRRSVAGSVVEIIDSHTGSKSPRRQKIIGIVADYDLDVLWILSQTSDGDGQILVFDLETREIAYNWPLPSGRWWVPGLCDLGPGQGMLLGAAADTKTHAGAEIWRFLPIMRHTYTKQWRRAQMRGSQLLY